MKIYSDTLTVADFVTALGTTAGLGFEEFEKLPRVRKRARGWQVLLYRHGSSRPFATGQFGASDHRGAASWADWGWFLAALYEADPDMAVASVYRSRDDFHAKTRGTFRSIASRAGGTPDAIVFGPG